jgi:hypothetical protein
MDKYKKKEDNEIMELIYIGKCKVERAANKNADSIHINKTMKEYRQFIVSRKNHLEMVYTNGIIYWAEKIEGSDVKRPFFIQDIILSDNKMLLIAYCVIPGDD